MKCYRQTCKSTACAGDVYHGLCMSCYTSAKKLVTGGQTTWEGLASLNMCAGTADPFVEEFKKLQDEKNLKKSS